MMIVRLLDQLFSILLKTYLEEKLFSLVQVILSVNFPFYFILTIAIPFIPCKLLTLHVVSSLCFLLVNLYL